MNNADIHEFTAMWSGIGQQFGKTFDVTGIEFNFSALRRFELVEIKQAMTQLIQKKRFFPSIAEVIEEIEGVMPTQASLFAMAQQKSTPIGIFVRKCLGSHIVDSTGERQATPHIAGQMDKIEDFHRRALVGDYTDEEIRMIQAYGVDAAGDLCPTLRGPRLPYRDKVAIRCAELHQHQIGSEAGNKPSLASIYSEKNQQVAQQEMNKIKEIISKGTQIVSVKRVAKSNSGPDEPVVFKPKYRIPPEKVREAGWQLAQKIKEKNLDTEGLNQAANRLVGLYGAAVVFEAMAHL